MLRFFALAFVLAGCTRAEPEPRPEGTSPPATTTTPAPKASAAPLVKAATTGGGSNAPLVLARGIRFVKADTGDVEKVVRVERERAKSDGRDLIVYVGATWCEPCQKFHAAAKRGELDGEFPDLTILEFDLDDDRERLMTAGYESRLIPLFVAPDAQGKPTSRRFEGGMKGDQAVASIAPRLRQLLTKP